MLDPTLTLMVNPKIVKANMRINCKSVPHTQLLWNIIYKIVEDHLPFVKIVVREGDDVLLSKSGIKTVITTEEYSKLENPIEFYLSKIEKIVVKMLTDKLEKVILELPRKPQSETLRTLCLDSISKNLAGKELNYTGTPLQLTIEPIDTYVTLEDFDEESGEYSTAVFLTADFLIAPSEYGNLFISYESDNKDQL